MAGDRRRDRQDPGYIGGDPGFWEEPRALNDPPPPEEPPSSAPPSRPASRRAKRSGLADGPAELLGWAKAIALGARDTWNDILSEGREGARQSYQKRWHEFEGKTKFRRNDKDQGA